MFSPHWSTVFTTVHFTLSTFMSTAHCLPPLYISSHGLHSCLLTSRYFYSFPLYYTPSSLTGHAVNSSLWSTLNYPISSVHSCSSLSTTLQCSNCRAGRFAHLYSYSICLAFALFAVSLLLCFYYSLPMKQLAILNMKVKEWWYSML
jgi:hypothetical protein